MSGIYQGGSLDYKSTLPSQSNPQHCSVCWELEEPGPAQPSKRGTQKEGAKTHHQSKAESPETHCTAPIQLCLCGRNRTLTPEVMGKLELSRQGTLSFFPFLIPPKLQVHWLVKPCPMWIFSDQLTGLHGNHPQTLPHTHPVPTSLIFGVFLHSCKLIYHHYWSESTHCQIDKHTPPFYLQIQHS